MLLEVLDGMFRALLMAPIVILVFLLLRMLIRHIIGSLHSLCTLHRRPIDWSWRPPPPGWGRMWRLKPIVDSAGFPHSLPE